MKLKILSFKLRKKVVKKCLSQHDVVVHESIRWSCGIAERKQITCDHLMHWRERQHKLQTTIRKGFLLQALASRSGKSKQITQKFESRFLKYLANVCFQLTPSTKI